jgi:hypothetical protein
MSSYSSSDFEGFDVCAPLKKEDPETIKKRRRFLKFLQYGKLDIEGVEERDKFLIEPRHIRQELMVELARIAQYEEHWQSLRGIILCGSYNNVDPILAEIAEKERMARQGN